VIQVGAQKIGLMQLDEQAHRIVPGWLVGAQPRAHTLPDIGHRAPAIHEMKDQIGRG